jgi:acyl carrier protein
MNEVIRDRLLAFVAEQFGMQASEINTETSLVDQGIIDSIGLIEIAGFMEDTYGFSIVETEMTRENFGSLVKMAAFVSRKQAA